jgi:hypothetical protein
LPQFAVFNLVFGMTLSPAARPALLAALVALALYAVTLRGTFIFDDVNIIREDPRLYEPGQWRKIFNGQYWPDGTVDNLYRPLVSFTYALQWHLIGAKPPAPHAITSASGLSAQSTSDDHAFPFHLFNWLLAAVVAAMVAELARRLTAPAPGDLHNAGNAPAYIAGLLFAMHPLHVEVVAGLVGRAEMLCGIGLLGALILLLHRPITPLRSLAVVGCIAFSIFSKEQGLLLPLLILLLPLCLGITRPRSESERSAVLLLIFLLCLFETPYMLIREHYLPFDWEVGFLDFSDNPLVKCTPHDRLLMPLVLLGHYTQLLVFPWRLSPDYGGRVFGWVVHLNDPYLYLGIASLLVAIASLIALIWRYRQNGRLGHAALYSLLAAGALYGMVGNIVSLIGTNFGERLMYLPSAFLAIFIAIALCKLPRFVMIGVMSIAIVLGSIRTVTYAHRWNDRYQFYKTSAAEQPLSVRLHMLVAVEALSRGDLDIAKEADRQARESLPDYSDALIQSAQVAMVRGELDDATTFLTHAWKIDPGARVSAWFGKLNDLKKQATSQPH